MGKEKAIIFPCFGGSSNVGVTTALATLEAVEEVGLDKAGIGCLAIIPIFADSMKSQMDKAKKDYICRWMPCSVCQDTTRARRA